MDLVPRRNGKLYGFEFKVSEQPRISHSMTTAQKDLCLEAVYLVYPGELSFQMREGFHAFGYTQIHELKL